MGARVMLFLVAFLVLAQVNEAVQTTTLPQPQDGKPTAAVVDTGSEKDSGMTEAMTGQPPAPAPGPIDWDVIEKVEEFYNYWVSVVAFSALLLNLMALYVFTYTGIKEGCVNMVLIGLAIADILALISHMDYATYFWSDFSYSLMQNTDLGCKLIQYVVNIARDCSSYFILTFTVDRFLAVCYPLKRNSLMTKKKVAIAMLVIVLCSAAAEVYMPILLTHNPVGKYCHAPDATKMARYSSAFRNGLGFIVPFVAVAVLNALIIRQLHKYEASNYLTSKPGAKASGESHNRSLTVMLVIVSTFSFIVYLPKAIFFFCVSYGEFNNTAFMAATYLTDALAMLNFACNFFFYYLSNSQFRKNLKNAFVRPCSCCTGGGQSGEKNEKESIDATLVSVSKLDI